MRHRWQRYKPVEPVKEFVANDKIRVPEVFLINDEGVSVGRISTAEALRLAQEADLDLALVNPKADPPVAKMVNLGQLKYEQEKKAHRQKVAQKKVDVKEIRLSVRIGEHDFNFRLQQAEEFLKDGDKIKLEVVLKGREKQHPKIAEEVIYKFFNALKANPALNVAIEQDLTRMGGRYNIVIMNKK
ncbi:MAG TPA: translation initiation factor IF-3 [Candidatus Methylomirabilis sp.]|nr:translation initiation factor IF-3 [Candidatus Methylomirabilis sp.]